MLFFIKADHEITDPAVAAELKKRRTFRTFSYRGVELDKLLDLSNDDVRFHLTFIIRSNLFSDN